MASTAPDDAVVEFVRLYHQRSAGERGAIVWGAVEVHVQYVGDGDDWDLLFTYYPDEISFTASELQGKTKRQVMQLFHDRDVAYLRSP